MSDDPTRPDLSLHPAPPAADPAREPESQPERAVLTEVPGVAPAPEVRPVATPEPSRQPFGDSGAHPSADPQAGVETKELSLADLREAARRAGAALEPADAAMPDPASPEPDAAELEIDLVEAERQEAAQLAGVRIDQLDDDSGAPTSGSIDPRIRERRVAVTRAEGRRRLRVLLTAVCIASAIGIAWLVVQSPLLAVNSINVKGATQESQASVRAAAGVRTGSPLLFVDTGAVARRIEALPWVASAKVDRGLPNDLDITVVERATDRVGPPSGAARLAARNPRCGGARRPLGPGARRRPGSTTGLSRARRDDPRA